MIAIIASVLVTILGLFAGWLATIIYHAQEEASRKLDDEFHGKKTK